MQAGVLRSSELTFSTTRPPDRPGVETLLPKLGVRVGSEGTHLLEAYPTVPLAAVGGSLELHCAPSRLSQGNKGDETTRPPLSPLFSHPSFRFKDYPSYVFLFTNMSPNTYTRFSETTNTNKSPITILA